MHKAARFQRFLAKVDQQTQPVAALMQVEQALFHIFRPDLAGGFGFQDKLVFPIFDEDIDPPFGDHDAIIGNRISTSRCQVKPRLLNAISKARW